MDYLQKHKENADPGTPREVADDWFKSFRETGKLSSARAGDRGLFMLGIMRATSVRLAEAASRIPVAMYVMPRSSGRTTLQASTMRRAFGSLLDISGAPETAIDFLAPDTIGNFKDWCDKYDRSGNPLFIPEAAGGAVGAANVFYPIGQHNAFGFSPFAIERGIGGGGNELAQSYDVLSQLAPLILRTRPREELPAS